jgi:hypothetical protein
MGLLFGGLHNNHALLHGIIDKCTLTHDNRRIIYNNNHVFKGRDVIHIPLSIITPETGLVTTESNRAFSQTWETRCDSVTNQEYYIHGDGVGIA